MPPPHLTNSDCPKLWQTHYSETTNLVVVAVDTLAPIQGSMTNQFEQLRSIEKSHHLVSFGANSKSESARSISTEFDGNLAVHSTGQTQIGQEGLANPTVSPPPFTTHWLATNGADSDCLTYFMSQKALLSGNSGEGTGGGNTVSSFGLGDNSPGDWGYHLDNNDGYWMQLNTVTFYGDGFTAVTSDLSQTVYAPPHWVDSNHNDRDDRTENLPIGLNLPGKDMGEPVSYARDSFMKTTISVNLNYIPPPPEQVYDNQPSDKTVYLRGITQADPSLDVMRTNPVIVGDPKSDELNLTFEMAFQEPLMDTVYHWGNMDIDWQYAYTEGMPASNSLAWTTFNESHNANYVTLNMPLSGTTLYLTLAYFATAHAHGESEVPNTVAKMWDYGFKDAAGTIRAEDAALLHYYHDWNADITSLSDLLKDNSVVNPITNQLNGGDGQCHSFAELWNQMLAAQGIDSDIKKIAPKTQGEDGFIVNDWGWTQKNAVNYTAPNGIIYEWYNQSATAIHDNDQFTFDIEESVIDASGLPGQNEGNPNSLFSCHYIVLYNGVFYDPSYGKSYSSLLQLDDEAIAGYFYEYSPIKIYFRQNAIGTEEINFG